MKRLLVLFVVLFAVFFSYTIIAQEMGALRKGFEINLPEKVQTPLGAPLAAGTYTIGTGGYFPTIDSAFKKLSADGVAGAVTLELINTLYVAPTDSFGFKLVGPIPGAGPNSRVTIKPSANKNVTIEGNSFAVLFFLNTSYVTIDGVSITGANTLTIHSFQNTFYGWNDGIDFINNSDHNVIQNIIFICEDYTRIGNGPGCFSWSGSSVAADSNLIQFNFIKKAGFGIIVDAELSATVRATGNIIRGNIIGSEIDSLINRGIHTQRCLNTIIENNIVQNIRFLNNDINPGINSYWGNGEIIRNNVVHNVYANSGNWGGVGILLSGASGQEGVNNSVYNNLVYDIRSSSIQANSSVDGIGMWRQINPKIYYNSVYLTGNGNGANPLGSQALAIWNNCTNVDTRNNIFVNTRNESPFRASAIQISSGSSLNTSNFNDLYYSTGTNNCLVRMYGVNYNTLAEWQTTGKDLNSITEIPNFVSPDLHINSSVLTNIESHATPIAGITTDFDGNLRNATTPDIGADEFNGTVVPVELTSFAASVIGTEVLLNWSTATELNNQGFEVQRKALGGDFATVAFVKGQGTTTQQNQYSFTDKNLDEGKYFYRLKQLDFSGTFEYSKTIEVEVSPVLVYSLGQNYPNPFNPTTKISWQSPVSSQQTLKIYDVLGNEIGTLVNEEKEAGSYEVEFNASKFSSGVYFYKLRAGEFTSVRKMILLR